MPIPMNPLPASKRAGVFFFLASYAILSAVPFAPWLSGKAVRDPAWLLGIEALTWLAVWAIFKRPKYFHWLLLPAFVLLPADAYLYASYGRGVTVFHLAIVTETNTREMAEFLGTRIWPILAVIGLAVAWWWLILRVAFRTDALDWTGPARKWALAALAILGAFLAYAQSRQAAMQLPPERAGFADTRPFGIFATAAEYARQQERLADLDKQTRGFRFGARQLHPDDKPMVIVVVLGESSRFDRWSLNGYARDTDPLLERETNLISAPNVVASASATLLSLPTMLSRKKAMDTYKTGFREQSFIAAFKEAGFKTWWLSNQIPFGEFDTPVSVFAKQADVVQFLNLGGYNDVSSLDEILAQPYQRALADPAPKKLIILHTLGNHWNYSRRYSAGFDRWRPSLFNVDDPDHTDSRLKDQISNSYDDSVLYSDWYLSQVIASLKASGQASAMLYVSDHGENLHDGSCDFVLHGHNSQYDYHVPMLFWYSDAYASARPHKVELIKRQIAEKLSTENIFDSLLDIADVGFPGQQLEWSFASDRFKPHTRYVDSYGWADYDRSTFDGDCREVIDPNALPRSAGRM